MYNSLAANEFCQQDSCLDPYLLQLVPNQLITVSQDTGLVLDVCSFSSSSELPPETIDLRHLTVLPGFVDVHVHFFLQFLLRNILGRPSYKGKPGGSELSGATVHARKTLMAGYTSRSRSGDGKARAVPEISLRKCLSGSDPLIPGPRYFTANRAIVSTGVYGPKSSIQWNQEGVEGSSGAEAADEPAECDFVPYEGRLEQAPTGSRYTPVRHLCPSPKTEVTSQTHPRLPIRSRLTDALPATRQPPYRDLQLL
ncbi:hypothetical protein MSAN_02470900 [Mycena sanguinolenta]|uniref:Amidohydrolase-related domain-containing protein n=1 Tax=Mycena sanguinolenta TaxID=230812 RepID=A0A8H6U4G6_9AGAR|nr:hypothetical protein MSAN_02470900 [Mycena sanguinolenta]